MGKIRNLQGIVNNFVYSFCNHPANYWSFWTYLFIPESDVAFSIDLLNSNELPDLFEGEVREEMENTIKEYRFFLQKHLVHLDIDRSLLESAIVNINKRNSQEGEIYFETTLKVITKDNKIFEATINVDYWSD